MLRGKVESEKRKIHVLSELFTFTTNLVMCWLKGGYHCSWERWQPPFSCLFAWVAPTVFHRVQPLKHLKIQQNRQIQAAIDLKKLSLFYWNMCFFLKNVCRRLAKGVVSTQPLSTRGGTQMANFVNEDGLYDVILDSSRVVDATANKRFRWLILVKNSEVFLTSIST